MIQLVRISLILLGIIPLSPAFAEPSAETSATEAESDPGSLDGTAEDACPDQNEEDYKVTAKKLKIKETSRVLKKISGQVNSTIKKLIKNELRGCFDGVTIKKRYANSLYNWDREVRVEIFYQPNREDGGMLSEESYLAISDIVKTARKKNVVEVHEISYRDRRPSGHRPRRPGAGGIPGTPKSQQ